MQETAKRRMMYVLFLLPIPLLAALCVPFLGNPLVFDDMYFFLQGEPEKYLSSGFHLGPRKWVYQTLAMTFVFIGPELHWFRIGNLAIHIGTAIVLFALVRRLVLDLDAALPSGLRAEGAALVAATLFVFHPLAVFAQGYLIERTILCATLFALLCWLLFWHGLKGSRTALWGSCAAFALSIFAKEHAVMVPAVCFLLLVLHMRSGSQPRIKLPEILSALFLQGLVALFVILQVKGILGTAYEPLTGEMLGDTLPIPPEHLYPLSVMNQAGLYFKYLLLWAMPNPGSISLDMRESFPTSFGSWMLWGGALLYVAYGAFAAFLLSRGKTIGLAGLAMLGSWVLFFTEFSVARLQEPFVLYRSYLWMPLLFILGALAARKLSNKLLYALFPMFLIFFALLSFDRLTVLSHPYHVWDEAAQLFEKKGSKEGVLGGYRLYYNRGHALYREGMLDAAMEDYDRALAQKPDYGYAYHEQGVIYLDKKEWGKARISFEKALSLLPKNVKTWSGRGYALEGLGDTNQARMSFLVACSLGSARGCEKAGVGTSVPHYGDTGNKNPGKVKP